MREAGDVCYADVQKDGVGMVESITQKEDMEYALRKLDDTKFRSMRVKLPYIRVYPREAPAMATRSLSLGLGAVTLHTKAGVPTLLSGPLDR